MLLFDLANLGFIVRARPAPHSVPASPTIRETGRPGDLKATLSGMGFPLETHALG
jgi:hypothetical protein